MVELKRKQKESLEGFMRRFKRKLQKSGKPWLVKKRRYYERPKNNRRKKDEAKYRMKRQKEIEILRRLGKLNEFENKHRR